MDKGNADHRGIVQPSQQHIASCVKVVEWGFGTRGVKKKYSEDERKTGAKESQMSDAVNIIRLSRSGMWHVREERKDGRW